jgi:hypothetical protein
MTALENSYEGAMRRMQRLGFENVAELAAPPRHAADSSKINERMRELEELATLACDENERLEAELETLREENAVLMQRLAALRATSVATAREPVFAREPTPAPAPAPTREVPWFLSEPSTSLVDSSHEVADDEPDVLPRRRGLGFVLAAAGLAIAGVGAFVVAQRPSAHVVVRDDADVPTTSPRPVAQAVVVPAAVVAPPTVVVPPAPAPIAAPVATKHRSANRAHASKASHRRPASKKAATASAKSSAKHNWNGNDPLDGLKL